MSRANIYAVQISTPEVSSASTPMKIASFSQIDGRKTSFIPRHLCACRVRRQLCPSDPSSQTAVMRPGSPSIAQIRSAYSYSKRYRITTTCYDQIKNSSDLEQAHLEIE